MPASPVHILLVDDDPGDVRICLEGLKDAKVANNVQVAHDGDQALAYLRREGDHAKAQRPDLVLLDINMPRKNGHETLREIKSDPSLKEIPVVMLTTSDADRDVFESYSNHANAYVKKPVELDAFLEVIREIDSFWLSIVRLPPKDK